MVRRDCTFVAVTFTSLLLVSSAVSQSLNLPDGANCRKKNGDSGKCKLLTSCPSELQLLREDQRHYRPTSCGFKGKDPIICCAEPAKTPAENETPTKDVNRSGRKAEAACSTFESQINSSFVPYIISGQDTYKGEFPHMVAVGFWREEGNGIAWDCGGSLISPEFVLTAAHCVLNTRWGRPDFVRVGVHNLTNLDEGRQLRVLEAIEHPDYKYPSHYNDVALLKIPNVNFDEDIAPACLYTKMDPPKRMIVTGWGTYDEDLSRTSDVLLKAELVPVPETKCNNSFYGKSAFITRLSRGIAPEMICARGANNRSDTCGGDSGGPMQSKRSKGVLYDIIGVTSFGSLCGGIGVYDRVASFMDWIESHVWPD